MPALKDRSALSTTSALSWCRLPLNETSGTSIGVESNVGQGSLTVSNTATAVWTAFPDWYTPTIGGTNYIAVLRAQPLYQLMDIGTLETGSLLFFCPTKATVQSGTFQMLSWGDTQSGKGGYQVRVNNTKQLTARISSNGGSGVIAVSKTYSVTSPRETWGFWLDKTNGYMRIFVNGYENFTSQYLLSHADWNGWPDKSTSALFDMAIGSGQNSGPTYTAYMNGSGSTNHAFRNLWFLRYTGDISPYVGKIMAELHHNQRGIPPTLRRL